MNSEPDFLFDLLPELRAGGFDKLDGTVQFYSRVNALIQPNFTVVDFGAGRGEPHIDDLVTYRRNLRTLKGKVREVIGVDVDPVVQSNPALDRAIVLSDKRIPLPDGSADMIVSDFTFEHISDPKIACAELDRILKPGGWLCARTPNRHGYIAIVNRIVSPRLKSQLLHGAQPSRKEEDVFPAYYRLNTISSLKTHFPSSRYEHATYVWDACPAYHFNSRALFSLLKLTQLISPSVFKTTLMIFAKKRNRPAN
ncbi:class I SAM-dependent methyltransferase [Bradyrhizobium sp. STM 3561]|uniref:class I SAM-dependent methyltransferase n=1 Tax=Bradyrhizobium sp. STM 3561 TaxID=578923 RepID=UPI0038900BC2